MTFEDQADVPMFPARPVAKGCALASLVPAFLGGLPVVSLLILAATGQATPRWSGIVILSLWTIAWLAFARRLWRRADRFA